MIFKFNPYSSKSPELLVSRYITEVRAYTNHLKSNKEAVCDEVKIPFYSI